MFASLATTGNCPVAAMADPARRLFAVQFHPEVAHTPQGKTVVAEGIALRAVVNQGCQGNAILGFGNR